MVLEYVLYEMGGTVFIDKGEIVVIRRYVYAIAGPSCLVVGCRYAQARTIIINVQARLQDVVAFILRLLVGE